MARVSEWHGELARIMESPIVGNGFGASFRFFDVLTYAHQWYPFSHNSYLFILFKTGLIGGILFFGALLGFVLKGFRLLREPMLDARARMLLRAVMASILVQLFGAFTGPTFCSKTPMVWLGLCWGFLLATEKRLGREDSQSLT
jgi:O-antigen ligase